jgi:hypothetical protein
MINSFATKVAYCRDCLGFSQQHIFFLAAQQMMASGNVKFAKASNLSGHWLVVALWLK